MSSNIGSNRKGRSRPPQNVDEAGEMIWKEIMILGDDEIAKDLQNFFPSMEYEVKEIVRASWDSYQQLFVDQEGVNLLIRLVLDKLEVEISRGKELQSTITSLLTCLEELNEESIYFIHTRLEGSPAVHDTECNDADIIQINHWRGESSIPLSHVQRKEMEIVSSAFLVLNMNKETKRVKIRYHGKRVVECAAVNLLRDAVKIVNMVIRQSLHQSSQIELACHSESSIFSQRPDHFVVCNALTRTPIMTMEVKTPLNEYSESLYDSKAVRGRSYDCLEALKLQGHSNPMHITTTIQETLVAWLPDNNFIDSEYNNHDQSKMGELWEKVLAGYCQSDGECETQPPLKEKTRTKTKIKLSSTDLERTICVSQIFKAHQLLKVMVNVILCSIHGSARSWVIPKLEIGEQIKLPALKLTKKKYQWVTLETTVKGSVNGQYNAFRKPKCVYVIGTVGTGSTSKAFRIITSDGYEGVAKMFLLRHYNKTRLGPHEFEKRAKSSVSRELGVFTATYPKMKVFRMHLFNHEAIILPFLKPIAAQDRMNYEKKIKEQLCSMKKRVNRFGTQPIRYKEEDRRWCHVGLLDGSVRGFNFNNMEDVQESEVERAANEHWEELKLEAGQEIVA